MSNNKFEPVNWHVEVWGTNVRIVMLFLEYICLSSRRAMRILNKLSKAFKVDYY